MADEPKAPRQTGTIFTPGIMRFFDPPTHTPYKRPETPEEIEAARREVLARRKAKRAALKKMGAKLPPWEGDDDPTL